MDERPLIGPYGDSFFHRGDIDRTNIYCLARGHLNTVTFVTDFNCYGCRTLCMIPEQHVGCYATGTFEPVLKLEPKFEEKLCHCRCWPQFTRNKAWFHSYIESLKVDLRPMIQLVVMERCRYVPEYLLRMYPARTDCAIL